MLQDDQTAGEENEATGLLTAEGDEGRRKTRIAARWLEGLGWPTALIERRHFGDIRLQSNDPAVVVTGLDAPEARVKIARAGFAYMVDAGVGHGPVDFENTQIRILRSGVDAQAFWSAPERHKDVDALMKRAAYQVACRCIWMAAARSRLPAASVAVPFVGAALGALTIAQVLRLGSMLPTIQMMQVDLGAPEMAMTGAMNDAPAASLKVEFA